MNPKATYLEFERNPDLEFEHSLALALGGMTVADLRARMGTDEYLRWKVYFARREQERQIGGR